MRSGHLAGAKSPQAIAKDRRCLCSTNTVNAPFSSGTFLLRPCWLKSRHQVLETRQAVRWWSGTGAACLHHSVACMRWGASDAASMAILAKAGHMLPPNTAALVMLCIWGRGVPREAPQRRRSSSPLRRTPRRPRDEALATRSFGRASTARSPRMVDRGVHPRVVAAIDPGSFEAGLASLRPPLARFSPSLR